MDPELNTYKNLDDCFDNADAVLVLTNHPSFTQLDIGAYAQKMKKPPILVDGWHVFDPQEMIKLGFVFAGVGIG